MSSAVRAAPAPGFFGRASRNIIPRSAIAAGRPGLDRVLRAWKGRRVARSLAGPVSAALLVACLLAMGPATAARASAPVLVLGDSISAAYGMSLEQGWVALLEHRLAADGFEGRIVNASISGDTSAGGLRRLPALLEEHEPQLLVLELGGNDGLRGYPTTALRENLTEMAALGIAAGARVLILPMEIPPNYGPRYTRSFRAAFREAAEASGARLGPFMLDGIATEVSLMQDDGIHPTAAAQPLIADLLEPVVKSLLDESHAPTASQP